MLTIAHTGDLIAEAVEATFVCFYHRLELASSSKTDISSLLASWLAHASECYLSMQRKWSRRCGHTGHRHILPGCNTDGPTTRYYITLVQIRPSGEAPSYHCNHVTGPSTVLLPPDRKKQTRIFDTSVFFLESHRTSASLSRSWSTHTILYYTILCILVTWYTDLL